MNGEDIAFCRSHYKDPRASFLHLKHSNRSYAPEQTASFQPYPFEDESFDLATALSVWTHLNEADGIFYACEVARTLRSGGKAVLTFFYLDEDYEKFLKEGISEPSIYSVREPARYRFDQPVDGSADWLCPAWVPVPESAIGITPAGMDRLQDEAGLRAEQVPSRPVEEHAGALLSGRVHLLESLGDRCRERNLVFGV